MVPARRSDITTRLNTQLSHAGGGASTSRSTFSNLSIGVSFHPLRPILSFLQHQVIFPLLPFFLGFLESHAGLRFESQRGNSSQQSESGRGRNNNALPSGTDPSLSPFTITHHLHTQGGSHSVYSLFHPSVDPPARFSNRRQYVRRRRSSRVPVSHTRLLRAFLLLRPPLCLEMRNE